MNYKEKRKKKKLSQSAVAVAVGISLQAYRLIESGATRNPRPKTKAAIEMVLSC